MGFPERLIEAFQTNNKSEIGRLSGFAYSTINKYFQGSLPGIDKAETLARKANVNFLWLATGEGPKYPGKERAKKKSLEERLVELQHDFPDLKITVEVKSEEKKACA